MKRAGRQPRLAHEIPERAPEHRAQEVVVHRADVLLEPAVLRAVENHEPVGVVVRVGEDEVRRGKSGRARTRPSSRARTPTGAMSVGAPCGTSATSVRIGHAPRPETAAAPDAG